jgi:D-alanyl-D-alanine carboxypeptidase/D-alanyl-D-alanine-endopeptidase (penicillin-binding protein 4)
MLLRAVALAAALTVPPLSGAPWTDRATAALDRDLDRILAAAPAARAANLGLLVESATDGTVLYARRADRDFQPASTLKLLVGSAALDRLGPDYRFTTLLAREPLPGGGDELILHGGGDPLLRGADLDAAADAVRAAGIARAAVTLDESHDAPADRRGPGWSIDDVLQYYAPVVDGLPFEENVLALTLVPGAAPGTPPVLQLPPPFVPLSVPAGSCVPAPTLLTFTEAAQTVAADRPDTSDVAAGPCGDVVVTGGVPLGTPAHVDAAVDQPEALALRYFTAALRARGVEVLPPVATSGPVAGVVDTPFSATPPGTIVWRHDGEPLSALIADMWLPSDNLIAELLVRELDVAANGRAGTLYGGTEVERAWLSGIGVDPATLTLADGSGLSQYDRATPRALAAILLHDWRSPYHDAVLDALPVAGVRGDLRGLMTGTTAEGRVYAKTGSMSHVRGLAGYVATRTHGTVIFALSIDDWIGTDAGLDALRAAICSRLAES